MQCARWQDPVPGDDFATDPKSGAAPLLALDPPQDVPGRKGDGKRNAGEQSSRAYPAGKRLSQPKIQHSIAHAPVDAKTKLPICWDAACHIGCFPE